MTKDLTKMDLTTMEMTARGMTAVHLAAGLILYGTLRLAATSRFEKWGTWLGLLSGMIFMLYANILLLQGTDAILIGCCVTATAWSLGMRTFRINLRWGSRSWTFTQGEPGPDRNTKHFRFRLGTEPGPE